MKVKVEGIYPWKVGGDLFRINLELTNDKDELVKRYEVWTLLSCVQYQLRIDTSPSHSDLARFGIEFFKHRLIETEYKPPETGAFYSEKGVKFGMSDTFPGSLGDIEHMIQTNIIFPANLHQWAKIESAKTKLSLSELVRLGLQDMRQRSSFREKSNELFDHNEKLRSIANDIFDGEYKNKGNGFKSVFLGYALGKAYKTQEAIITLCQRGYGEDAAQLVRTLMDLAITTAYIFKDPTDGRVTRYLDFSWILKKNMYIHTLSKPELKAEVEKREREARVGDITTKKVMEEADHMQKLHKYNSPYQWSDKSLKGMAEEVGRINEYNTVYRLLSQLEHSATTTMSDYMSVSKNGFVVDVVRDSNWIMESLIASFDFYHSILRQFNEYNEVGLEAKLQEIEDSYVNSLSDRIVK